jgi:hypothetical protein
VGSLAKLFKIKEAPLSKETIPKKRSIGLFVFVNAINLTKEELIVDDWSESQYNPFMVNRALGFGIDTIMLANEMNCRPHLRKSLQFSFLINSVRPKKRYNKWVKAEKSVDAELVMSYYNFSIDKARAALRILTADQLDYIRQKTTIGGTQHGNSA